MSNPAGKIRARRLYYGWLVVMTVGLAGFAQSPGTFPVLSVLLTPITEEFHWNRTVFAGATSTGSILGGVVAFLLGAVLDRFGPRWIMTGALLVLGGALLLLSLISALWQFYLLIILTRVATMGVLGLALGVVVPKWFVVKRGRAVALSGIGGVAGGSITPLYVGMVAEMISWRAAAATAGLVVWAVALLPSILFLRRRPEDMGLLPDGLSQEELRHIQTPGQNAASTRARTEVSYTLRQVLRFRSFYLLVAAFTLLLVVMPGMVLHMVAYLKGRGLEPGQAVWVLVIWSASGAVGTLVCGFLAERFGARRVLSVALFLLALGIAYLLTVNSFPSAVLWGLYTGGIGGGIFNTLYPVILADYYGRESLGTVRGVVWPVQLVGNATGPLAAAMVYDATGSYVPIYSVFVALALAAALCAFLARPPARSMAVAAQTAQAGVSDTGLRQ